MSLSRRCLKSGLCLLASESPGLQPLPLPGIFSAMQTHFPFGSLKADTWIPPKDPGIHCSGTQRSVWGAAEMRKRCGQKVEWESFRVPAITSHCILVEKLLWWLLLSPLNSQPKVIHTYAHALTHTRNLKLKSPSQCAASPPLLSPTQGPLGSTMPNSPWWTIHKGWRLPWKALSSATAYITSSAVAIS